MRPAIEVIGVGKRYGGLTALDDVSLQATPGTVLGVLGHNGAGKTTLLDILSTRVRPSSGQARVCGFDVVRHPRDVRRHIGVAGQSAAVDETMSGRRNLVLVARLLGATPREAKARADELIGTFDLAEAADRPARTYSGGMRRRLDLAASLVGSPDVLFLDEPTTGLDPVSRTELWSTVAGLAERGTAVVLTTQYLEEADRLADRIVVLGSGKVVAEGRPADLKARLGRRTATVTCADATTTRRAAGALREGCLQAAHDDTRNAVVVSLSDPGDVAVVVRILDAVGAEIHDLSFAEPSLDDVYLSLHRDRSPAW